MLIVREDLLLSLAWPDPFTGREALPLDSGPCFASVVYAIRMGEIDPAHMLDYAGRVEGKGTRTQQSLSGKVVRYSRKRYVTDRALVLLHEDILEERTVEMVDVSLRQAALDQVHPGMHEGAARNALVDDAAQVGDAEEAGIDAEADRGHGNGRVLDAPFRGAAAGDAVAERRQQTGMAHVIARKHEAGDGKAGLFQQALR